jgi:glutamate formiminotransferase
VLECVPNVSEGRDHTVLDALSAACAPALLDRHVDRDHHRSVFTLVGAGVLDAVRALALAVAARVDLRGHRGVHPRLGALDVVPFVALHDDPPARAVEAAHEFAGWVADALGVPVFLYDAADPVARSLPEARRDAFGARAPDLGPSEPHPALGAVAVGARPPLVAVNCELASDDVARARRIARAVRERDGGLVGVRALGLPLASARRAQVSMNLVALDLTGLQGACSAVRDLARADGDDVVRIELVGLVPAAELARCDQAFLEWSGIGPDQTIEARLE